MTRVHKEFWRDYLKKEDLFQLKGPNNATFSTLADLVEVISSYGNEHSTHINSWKPEHGKHFDAKLLGYIYWRPHFRKQLLLNDIVQRLITSFLNTSFSQLWMNFMKIAVYQIEVPFEKTFE